MGMSLIEADRFLLNRCLICEHLRAREIELLNILIDAIASSGALDERLRFCQPHFRSMGAQLDGNDAKRFSDIQKLHNEQLLKELRAFVGKRDCRSKHTKDESTSW